MAPLMNLSPAEFALMSRSLRQFIVQSEDALRSIEDRTNPLWDAVREELTADIQQAQALLARVNAAKE